MKIIWFLFFSVSLFAQKPALEVKIDSIHFDDSNSKVRKYFIDYHIENLTDKEVSFVLFPTTLIANAASSMTLYPIYKIYRNGVFEDMDGPFFEAETKEELLLREVESDSKEFNDLIASYKENRTKLIAEYSKKYKESGGQSTDVRFIYNNQIIMNSVQTMKPKETKKFTIQTTWNRNRFIKNDDLEYYLNENENFDFQLILDLKKSSFKEALTKEQLDIFMSNPNFIQGVFVSNKAKIEF